MKKKISTGRVDQIMNSLDGIEHADAPDFFYTRLSGKMQPEQKGRTSFLLRPAFIATVLSIFLLVNIFSLFEMNKGNKQDTSAQSSKVPTIETFASAYNMNTESVYE